MSTEILARQNMEKTFDKKRAEKLYLGGMIEFMEKPFVYYQFRKNSICLNKNQHTKSQDLNNFRKHRILKQQLKTYRDINENAEKIDKILVLAKTPEKTEEKKYEIQQNTIFKRTITKISKQNYEKLKELIKKSKTASPKKPLLTIRKSLLQQVTDDLKLNVKPISRKYMQITPGRIRPVKNSVSKTLLF